MTIALPAAPQRAPRRQIMVATALVSGAGFVLITGMLSMWFKFRAAAPTRESSDGLKVIKDWLPKDIAIPEVITNTMMITFVVLAVMVQWAVYSAKRRDSQHRSAALAIVAVIAVALINAQLAVYSQMDIGITDGAYQSMFYAVTGTVLLFIIAGLAFTLVALFRSLGGRDDDQQVISAHALYWYFLTAAFTALWFVVYVQK
jgi:cytochrome c oxidase subunit 3